LIEFADAVYKEKNRTTLIKHFYENLYSWTSSYVWSELGMSKNNCFICEDSKAAIMYLASRIPSEKSTVKSIHEIRAFGEYILSHFTQPVGKCISKSSLNDILNYLDKHLSLSNKIFPNDQALFIRIPYSHTKYNSECLTAINKRDIAPRFFLYHMKKRPGSAKSGSRVVS
jgi:hypothetical protein